MSDAFTNLSKLSPIVIYIQNQFINEGNKISNNVVDRN